MNTRKVAEKEANKGSSSIFPKDHTMSQVMEELKRMGAIGFPVVAMSLVDYLKSFILVACMGRIGSLELAGGALAIGFTNITGYSVLSGLAVGMEGLCSQSIGSKNVSMARLTLQRTILMLLLASVPIGLLWVNMEPLMLVLHQDPAIAQVASVFCRFAIPDLIANSLLLPLRIYLRSKGISWPLMWCSLFSVLLHVPITLMLAFTFSLGICGMAIATFITNFNTIVFLVCYMYFTTHSAETRGDHSTPLLRPQAEPSQNSLGREWRSLLKLALPSCIAVCLEWWWYEFMTILAGYLYKPKVALAASAIVIQTTSLMYTLPTGIGAAASTRVGNELGAGQPWKARLATMVAIALAIITSLFGLSWTTFGRKAWGQVFTEDNEVLELTMQVLPIIGLCELANCPQTTSCGILRGSARPGIGAGIYFSSFYLVGAPVAIFLAFVMKQGFLSLCYGLLAAQIACAVSIVTVVYLTDWEKESLRAQRLVCASDCDSSSFAPASTDRPLFGDETARFIKESDL